MITYWHLGGPRVSKLAARDLVWVHSPGRLSCTVLSVPQRTAESGQHRRAIEGLQVADTGQCATGKVIEGVMSCHDSHDTLWMATR